MNACDRLRLARLSVLDGKYEDALSTYVWFHHHALDEEPALYGVRLSFALSHWLELAAIYPPALVALQEIRDDKTSRLISGELDRTLFHDVCSINHYLSANAETVRLFEQLDCSHPHFASVCCNLALEALVEAHRFNLAAKYLPDPIGRIATLAQRLNEDIARIPERPRSKAPCYRAYSLNFASTLGTIVSILSGVDRHADAEECKTKALSLLKPWYVRKAVVRALADKL
jgi:hypothetical protein